MQIPTDAIDELPLALEPHISSTKPALQLASTLALDVRYGAYYLVLAERLDADLWTADARLERRMGDRGPRARLVGRRAAS